MKKHWHIITITFCLIIVMCCIGAISYLFNKIDNFINRENTTIVVGIENFKEQEGHSGINRKILPSEEFLSTFSYKEAEYKFIEKYNFFRTGTEISQIYILYSPEIYYEAKEKCLQSFSFSEISFDCDNFTYLENISHFGRSVFSENENPVNFNLFGFNDAKYTLMFIGIYCPYDRKDKDALLYIKSENELIVNWEDIVEEYLH